MCDSSVVGEATEAIVIGFQDRLYEAGYFNQASVSRSDETFVLELDTDKGWETFRVDTVAEVEELLDRYYEGWR